MAEQTKPPKQLDLIASAVRGAWHEYLETTRQLEAGFSYEEVEAWAWRRLGERLESIEKRRLVLVEGAAGDDGA